MNKFEYLVPKSLDEAVSMYDAHGDQAAYIAGGTDIVVKMKEYKIAPGTGPNHAQTQETPHQQIESDPQRTGPTGVARQCERRCCAAGRLRTQRQRGPRPEGQGRGPEGLQQRETPKGKAAAAELPFARAVHPKSTRSADVQKIVNNEPLSPWLGRIP